ncbi:ATP-grasp fold amidoligase family protein [Vibrio navarrensis]|uniref:ATP-grasp fold amidoligase family protein n=1 Tax=Vibrio navarrensis TaxID=29495 RepID=UPI00186A1D21|nr:ATP-grasp fold amidoligase family protein [Vibrio navarrensis]
MKNKMINVVRKCITPLLWDKLVFLKVFGRIPNVTKPKLYNEKIIQRKHFDKNYLYVLCADKLLVRNYIKDRVGEKYLIPLLYNDLTVENLLQLKGKHGLVIKANHSAGMVKVYDQEEIDDEEIKKLRILISDWLNTDYSKLANEWHYGKIVPKVYAEKSIVKNGRLPDDYKFHCFKQLNGDIKWVLQVISGRGLNLSIRYFDNSLYNCVRKIGEAESSLSQREVDVLTQAIELNKKLCEHFSYVRIDWYVSDRNLYFGELTFTPAGGYSKNPGQFLEKKMGEYWVL